MGIITAIAGAIGGTFADQWKEIITVGAFGERTVVSPGVLRQSNAGRGSNSQGSEGVISSGSKIFVPENTAAFIFSQSGIENVITASGGYEYQDGQDSLFNGDGLKKSVVDQVKDRVGYGGQTSDEKRIAFVNLREIRGIKFGTKGPVVYNDRYYEADLEISAFGSFSIQVTDAEAFVRKFLPANVTSYSFDTPQAKSQIASEFLQSFIDALNTLSVEYRISQLPSQAEEIAARVSNASSNAGTWTERFGLSVVAVGIESIELTAESRELVKQFSSNRMNIRAFEGTSQNTSNVAAQQKIAQGVENFGLGDGAGLLFGMGMVQGMNPQTAAPVQAQQAMSLDEQIATVQKLKGLLDAGILSEEQFESKKREVMGL